MEGLARLNQKASNLFNKNALEPSPSSTHAFGTKIRAKRKRSLPRGIAALAEKIVSDDSRNGPLGVDATGQKDPFMALDSMDDNMMDELLSDL